MNTLEQLGLERLCVPIAVKDIRPFAGTAWMKYKDETLDHFIKKMESEGIPPIVVIGFLNREEQWYEILAGESTLQACKKLGHEKVWAEVVIVVSKRADLPSLMSIVEEEADIDGEKKKVYKLRESAVFDILTAVERLTDFFENPRKIAEVLNRSWANILQYLKALELPIEVRALMQTSIPEEKRLGLVKASWIHDDHPSSPDEQIKHALKMTGMSPQKVSKLIIKKPEKE
jgi:uncharacterized ParB-like nuclease family protein